MLSRAPARRAIAALVIVFVFLGSAFLHAEPQKNGAPNYKAASQYSPQNLRQYVYDSNLVPNWIGKTDQFWYQFRTSKAYHAHSYFNMRDYALPDKKYAIEQLAARYPFIDLERVGIYGHSGGGFLSAAALLQKPYNEFFKAAVASAGNHDNNIYNNSWAERYHGLREVPATKGEATKEITKKAGTGKGRGLQKKEEEEDDEEAQDKDVKKDDTKKDDKTLPEMKFEIRVPTNAELAANLKGALLLVHGEIDNNVHPANTMRLADALIKANKRFDMLIIPGKRHGFADAQPYFQMRMWDFFAEHLLGHKPKGANILER